MCARALNTVHCLCFCDGVECALHTNAALVRIGKCIIMIVVFFCFVAPIFNEIQQTNGMNSEYFMAAARVWCKCMWEALHLRQNY